MGVQMDAELCQVCDINRGQKLYDDSNIFQGKIAELIVCQKCLRLEIQDFIDKNGDDSTYNYHLDDPYFIFENDAFIQKIIFNKLRIKIYSK